MMSKSLKMSKVFYTEVEAAGFLNISVQRLRSLLDEHIFNDGTSRPEDLSFCEADLVLIEFWIKSQENPKVIRMPRRN